MIKILPWVQTCCDCYKSELFKTNMAIESEKLFYQNALDWFASDYSLNLSLYIYIINISTNVINI